MTSGDAVRQAENWLNHLGVRSSDSPESVEATRAGGPVERRGGQAQDPPAPTATPGAATAEHEDWSLDADPEAVARSIVLRKLSARAHTRAELEKALNARRVPADAASAVLDRVAELGLVDDQAFARDWVESRQQRRHLSRTALRQELTRKGVNRDEIDVALADVDGDDELAAARALADKKRPTLEALEPHVHYRRMAGLLSRRGFSPGVISTVLAESRSSGHD